MSIPSISSTQSLNGYIALQRAHHKRELDESAGAFSVVPPGSPIASANPLISAIAVSLTQLGLTPALGTASTAASSSAITAASATNQSPYSADTSSMTADSLSANGALKTFPAFLAQLLAAAQQATDTDAASTSSSNGSAQAAAAAASTAATNAAVGSSNAVVIRGLAPLPQQPSGSQQVQQYRNIASTFSNLAQALSSSSSSSSPTSNGASSLTTVFQNLWTSLSSSHGTSGDSSGNAMPSLQTFLQTLARNFSESGISGLRGVFVDTVV
jgi:hypothetical protein